MLIATDPYNYDTDGDGFSDGEEYYNWNTSATDPDSNGWNVYVETYTESEDQDSDGLSSNDEVTAHGTDPNNPDTDYDGVIDGQEVLIYYTNPLSADTDGDYLNDGFEIGVAEQDGIMISDLGINSTLPLISDTDGDGSTDGIELKMDHLSHVSRLLNDNSNSGGDPNGEGNPNEKPKFDVDTDNNGLGGNGPGGNKPDEPGAPPVVDDEDKDKDPITDPNDPNSVPNNQESDQDSDISPGLDAESRNPHADPNQPLEPTAPYNPELPEDTGPRNRLEAALQLREEYGSWYNIPDQEINKLHKEFPSPGDSGIPGGTFSTVENFLQGSVGTSVGLLTGYAGPVLSEGAGIAVGVASAFIESFLD